MPPPIKSGKAAPKNFEIISAALGKKCIHIYNSNALMPILKQVFQSSFIKLVLHNIVILLYILFFDNSRGKSKTIAILCNFFISRSKKHKNTTAKNKKIIISQ